MTKKDLTILLKLSCHFFFLNAVKISKCYNKIIMKLIINCIIWVKGFSIKLYIAIYTGQKVIHSNIWLIYWFSCTHQLKGKK
jgi:hypothetical protein